MSKEGTIKKTKGVDGAWLFAWLYPVIVNDLFWFSEFVAKNWPENSSEKFVMVFLPGFLSLQFANYKTGAGQVWAIILYIPISLFLMLIGNALVAPIALLFGVTAHAGHI